MKRGEIWTQSGGSVCADKSRPVLIVQSDLLADTESVVICLFTSHESGALRSRLPFSPTEANGLREESDLMVDKIMSVARTRLGRRIGSVTEDDVGAVENAMLFVLGFAG